MTSNKSMCEGHRGRMREKLDRNGTDAFVTYEILEMLLYSVVRYKDTKKTAKLLLERFGSVHGVLSAQRAELMSVSGVGERIADFLISIGRVDALLSSGADTECIKPMNDYFQVGEYFVRYFADTCKSYVAALMLDNSMKPLEMKTVCEDIDFASARIRPQMFIEAAVAVNASVIILAHTHPFGPLYPSYEDAVNNNAVRDALSSMGVLLADHYIICGNRYTGFMEKSIKLGFSQHPEIANFYRSKQSFREGENR